MDEYRAVGRMEPRRYLRSLRRLLTSALRERRDGVEAEAEGGPRRRGRQAGRYVAAFKAGDRVRVRRPMPGHVRMPAISGNPGAMIDNNPPRIPGCARRRTAGTGVLTAMCVSKRAPWPKSSGAAWFASAYSKSYLERALKTSTMNHLPEHR
jgi:hypothetical protein